MAKPWVRSAQQECLDHLLVLGEGQLRRIVREYVAYFNTARPHQGLGQRIPELADLGVPRPEPGRTVRGVPVLGGLHHAYERVA